MADPIDDHIDEQVWLAQQEFVRKELWTEAEWAEARQIADETWGSHRSDLYLYDAENALRELHYRRWQRRWAAEEWWLALWRRVAAAGWHES